MKVFTCAICGNKCSNGALHCITCSNSYNPRHTTLHTEETKQKISNALQGNVPWNKGIKTHKKPHNWKGGRIKSGKYITIHMPQHHRASKKGYVLEHILICEDVLGKPLPVGAEIHHVDSNGSNNQNNNLILCQNRAYHTLLHIKEHALKACGNSGWRKCSYCKKYDSVDNLVYRNRNSRYGDSYHHKNCRKLYRKYGIAGFQTDELPFCY